MSYARMFYEQDFKEEYDTLYVNPNTHSLSTICYLFSMSSYIFMNDSKRSQRNILKWSMVTSEEDKKKQL